MPALAIEAQKLSFAYVPEQSVLENINFRVSAGDYVGIVGPNGSGKTTLLKIMLGILKPTRGSVKIFGLPPQEACARRWVGYVPQKMAQVDFPFPITAEEIVHSGNLIRPWQLSRQRGRVKAIQEALEITGVEAYARQAMRKLSGGMRQRVFIARALATQPRLLLLDEPAVGVDVASQERFFAFLKKLHRQQRITIMLVSHDIDMIVKEVSTVLCLNRTLLCHISREDFRKEEILARLYGPGKKQIPHSHSPLHTFPSRHDY
jgi:zinc transport system ATP-binding protein